MPKIDFTKIEDAHDFTPLPDGKYLCKLSEIEESETQNGDEMWKLRFEVIQGDSIGRLIFDNLVFSEAALKRVKLICSRLGVDTSGEVDLTPDTLKNHECLISVLTEEYEDNEGNPKKRNVVPFAGYERIKNSESETPSKNGEEHLPF